MLINRFVCLCLVVVTVSSFAGCETDPGDNADGSTGAATAPKTYAFDSRFETGSSVSYSGQVHRLLLIDEMKRWLGGVTGSIDSGKAIKAGDVKKQLMFFYDYKAGEGAQVPLSVTTKPTLKQAVFGDVSDKNLKDKIAGNDKTGQHKDWTKEFVGWSAAKSPESLVISWFSQLDDIAVSHQAGEIRPDPSGKAINKIHVTKNGQDLQQLIQKFLLGSVAFSQGADDYLDDDIDGKGLRSQNSKADKDGAAYTTLEHQWDEGFGYFGAARNYGDFTDDELSAKGGRDGWKDGYNDADADGKIDLKSEYNAGHSLNCAKRDRGSKDLAATDFTADAFSAFLKGRALIHGAVGRELSAAEMKELLAHRDVIVSTWEKAIAATVIHYINYTLADMSKFGTDAYNFYDHAKHWSELKGFALSLQFSRFSPLKAKFGQLHTLLGDAPVLPSADTATITSYAKALQDARLIIAQAYNFDAKLIGDDKGAGGW